MIKGVYKIPVFKLRATYAELASLCRVESAGSFNASQRTSSAQIRQPLSFQRVQNYRLCKKSLKNKALRGQGRVRRVHVLPKFGGMDWLANPSWIH